MSRLTSTEINVIIKPFISLLDASMQLCRTRTTFQLSDLYTFYYNRISGLEHNQRALADIAQTYVSGLTTPVNTEETHNLCLFFLETAPSSIIEQSIRSMIRCLQLNPFTVTKPYARFLVNVNENESRFTENTASVFRSFSIISMLNDRQLSSTHMNDLIKFINKSADRQIIVVFAQYMNRYILNGAFSPFDTETPLITNETLIKTILACLHLSGKSYIRPYKDWDQLYMQQAMVLKSFFYQISTIIRNNKEIMLECAYFYPDEEFEEYIGYLLLADADIQKILQTRNDKLESK